MDKCSNPDNICLTDDSKNGKNFKYEARNYWESQKFATSGLRLIFKNERNFRIQLIVAIAVVFLGFIFDIGHQDWIALFLLITLVLITESFNSVIEAVCDTISKEYRINIRYAKDVSAGAVFITAIVSAISGILILGPYALEFIKDLIEKYF
ncbi:MAG: diacylglycerol kinase family protein [bacterium]